MINLMIQEQFVDAFPEKKLETVCERALDFLGEKQTDITVVIDNDVFIQNLNRQYRGLDSATDVLSFEMGYTDPETNRKYLGDIVLSAETIARNADQNKASVEEETTLLLVHGILHLMGYDHATDHEQKEMWEKQTEILNFLRE